MKTFGISPREAKQEQERAKRKSYRNIKRRLDEATGVHATKGVPGIELYQKEDCPYSHAVRRRLSALGLDFIAHNVPERAGLKHKQLVEAGGKDQIPFLVDHATGAKLYESDAIIAYIDKEYGNPVGGPIGALARRLDSVIRARGDQIAWAIRAPYEKARDTVETVRGSARMLRRILRSVARPGATESRPAEAA